MEHQVFRTLLTAEGQEILQSAQDLNPSEKDFLTHFSALSRRYPAELARAALEIAILRLEAREKFPQAANLYFTRQAMEQATHWEVSQYRSTRYRAFPHVFDLGCSIGADSLALAKNTRTSGVDLDPLRLAMAQANSQALGLAQQVDFIQADLQKHLPFSLSATQALFFDPARRKGGKRSFSVQDYQPPLSIIQNWLPACPNLGIKISPGVQLEEIEGYPAEVEFISLRGELKEAVLWFGNLQTTWRRATLLPGPFTFTVPAGLEDTIPAAALAPQRQVLALLEPQSYLLEPDPAILRAGLVQPLGMTLGAAQLDAQIAYLTSVEPVVSPFVRTWKIEAWLPFSLKRLKAFLRERKVGQVTVKKRGSPLQPEELMRLLHLKETKENRAERVLVLTHLRGDPIVIICYPNW